MADPPRSGPAGGSTGPRGSDDDTPPLAELVDVLYPELRRLARRAMRREGPGHTLQATALVHEAYLRLSASALEVESKAHFLALAARVMRRILIDHDRGRNRIKRGGDRLQITLTEGSAVGEAPAVDLLALDQALRRLDELDPRRARLLEMQLFGGLTYGEMAEALEISEATVHRLLRLARAWLLRELGARAET